MSFDVAAPAVALIVFTFFARFQQRSWLAPGAFNAMYFSFIVGMTVFLEVYKLWPWALWWIFFGVVLFYLGNLAGEGYAASDEKKARPPEELRHRWLHVAIPISAALGISQIFLLHSYLMVAPTFDDIYLPPKQYTVLFTFMHLAPILGGMYFALESSRFRRTMALLSVAPHFLSAIVFSGRSGIVNVLALFFAGYFSLRVLLERGKVRLFTWRLILLAAVMGLVIYRLAFFITMFRLENTYSMPFADIFDIYQRAFYASAEKQEDIWEGFRHAYTGGVAAFSVWLEWRWYQPGEASWGYELISGTYELLGWRTRGAGLDLVEVEPGVYSNVLTRYGQLAHAFGIYGSQVWIFVVGLAVGWAYRRLKDGSILGIPIMVIFYNDVLAGGYAFNYNSMNLAYFLTAVYVILWNWSLQSQGRPVEAPEGPRQVPALLQPRAPLPGLPRHGQAPR